MPISINVDIKVIIKNFGKMKIGIKLIYFIAKIFGIKLEVQVQEKQGE